MGNTWETTCATCRWTADNKTKSSDGSSTVVPKRQGLGTRLFTASKNSSKSFICTIIIRFSSDDCYLTVFSSAQLSSFGPRSWDPGPLIGTCLIHQVDVLWPNQLLLPSCLHHSVVCWTRTHKHCWGLEALRWRDRMRNARMFLRNSYIFLWDEQISLWLVQLVSDCHG